MAKIVYALSGQGRGHTSRVMAISDELRRRGHEVSFCCGGTAREILEAKGEDVITVPPLRQVIEGNEIRLAQTIYCNWKALLDHRTTIARLGDEFEAMGAELLITDFEAFSPRAAERIGLPVLSFNHQQVVTETDYDLPIRHRLDAAITAFAIRLIAPSRPEHNLITSFFFPPVKDPAVTTLVPPIIRQAVQTLVPEDGDHVLVYYNHTDGAEHVLNTLEQIDVPFVVYNFDPPVREDGFRNLSFKKPSLDGFLEDLRTCKAVVCTAGFTLTSEALYLGKPLLVVPNRGIFEQTLNALFLEREGLGSAVMNRPIETEDVRTFLEESPCYADRLKDRRACGNDAAVSCIESVLADRQPRTSAHVPQPVPEAAAVEKG